jgi:hypothetical protein
MIEPQNMAGEAEPWGVTGFTKQKSEDVGNIEATKFFTVSQQKKIHHQTNDESGQRKKGAAKSLYTKTERKLGQKRFLNATKFLRELDKELRREERIVGKINTECMTPAPSFVYRKMGEICESEGFFKHVDEFFSLFYSFLPKPFIGDIKT